MNKLFHHRDVLKLLPIHLQIMLVKRCSQRNVYKQPFFFTALESRLFLPDPMARAETTVEGLQHSKQRFGSPTYELTNAKTQSCRVTKDENPMTLLALLTAVVFNVPASLGFSWSSRTMDKNDGKSCTSIWAYRAVFARECVLNGKGVYMRRQVVLNNILQQDLTKVTPFHELCL